MRERPHVILVGASPDTGNLGVSALFVSAVKLILHALPDARISLLDGHRSRGDEVVKLGGGRTVVVGRVGVRYNKTPWRRNHVVHLLAIALGGRLMPEAFRRWIRAVYPCLGALAKAEIVVDITGGDSFSDIYGLRRFLMICLGKWLVLASGADLAFLPQTYGPYKGHIARFLARGILCRASRVLSRDREGMAYVVTVMAGRSMRAEPQCVPDVAFVLDAIAPANTKTLPGPLPEADSSILVGINVSGLLWNGGYTRGNMFGLRSDYRGMILKVGRSLLERSGTRVLLVPHVFTPPGDVESDPDACRQVYESLASDFPGRVFVLEGEYDQSEIKAVISRCGFFVGARMHACIAAASQCVPVVPLAYSRKFEGVFETIGVPDLVADLRRCDEGEVVAHILGAFEARYETVSRLAQSIPPVQQRVLSLFASSSLDAVTIAPVGGSAEEGR